MTGQFIVIRGGGIGANHTVLCRESNGAYDAIGSVVDEALARRIVELLDRHGLIDVALVAPPETAT